MKIAHVSTYHPQQCGIATYTGHLIRGLRTVSPKLEMKVVAEKEASPFKQGRFEVVPCWDRNENYVEPIIRNTMDADIVHIQHEYAIYNFDDRLPLLLERLKASESLGYLLRRPMSSLTVHYSVMPIRKFQELG